MIAADRIMTTVGRFAPSPTGPLHAGSLLAAFGSWLMARRRGGLWHVRIEDVDRVRAVPGMAEQQLTMLQAFGLDWNGPIVRQSDRDALYQQYHDWFGERWWMLPNPSYGSWEPALFNNDYAQPREARRAAKRAALYVAP